MSGTQLYRQLRLLLYIFGTLKCVSVNGVQLRYNQQDSKNILEDLPVSVQPSHATCGPTDGSNVTYLNYFVTNPQEQGASGFAAPEIIRCSAASCPKPYPQTYHKVRKSATYELGLPGCSEVPLLLRDPKPSTTPAPSVRRKRQDRTKCSLSSMKPLGTGETHTLWIKPSPNHTVGTLISSQITVAFGVTTVSLDLKGQTLELWAGGNVRRYPEYNVTGGIWTFIALQVSMSREGTSIAAFVNGSILLEPVFLHNQPSRRRRAVSIGGALDGQPVFWGISGQPYFRNTGCQVTVVEECQAVGYSAYVRVLDGDLIGSEARTREALRRAKTDCPNTDSLTRTLYICSRLLPTCAKSGMPLKPCRSFCLEYTRTCRYRVPVNDGDDPCSGLNENNCVNANFIPEFGMYRGQIKELTSYGGLLTDRSPVPRQHIYRFGSDYRVPEAINDKSWPTIYDIRKTSWFSTAGVDDVTLTFEFHQRQVISNMTLFLGDYNGLWPAVTTFQLLDKGTWKDILYLRKKCPFTETLPMTTPHCDEIQLYSSTVSIALASFRRSGVRFVQDKRGNLVQLHPTVLEFLSGTALRVRMQGFLSELNHFYGIADLKVHAWQRNEDSCECFQGGLAAEPAVPMTTSSPANPCMYKCWCRQGAGDPAKSSYTCYPYISSLIPQYGPESGGTIVNITGGYFGTHNATVLYDDQVPLEILSINETMVSCRTPNRSGLATLDVPKSITLVLYEDQTYRQYLVLDEGFVFRGDPEIESISPLSTFLRGGINQTVVGQNLDSVFEPQMSVTVVYTEGQVETPYKQTPTICTVLNNTRMVCPSPDIRLPERFSQLFAGSQSNRKKRDAEVPSWEGDHTSRTKRAASRSINRDDFQFYVGFALDGVTKYNNVSETLPQYGIINVFYDPKIHPWEDNGGVKVFQPYVGVTPIRIDGERLSYGCTEKDYEILIGDEICPVLALYANALQCTPPKQKPLGGLQVKGAPQVTVRVGNIAQLVGYLEYHETAWDDPKVKGAIIGVLVVLIVIAIIVLITVWWKKRMAQARENSEANKYSEAPTPWSMIPANVKAELKPCLKDDSCLKLGRKLGEGNFGTVYIGRYTDEAKGTHILVAAKTIKDKGITTKSMMEFLEEATLMKDFDHENVLNLVGVVVDDNKPYVVLPLMENGDLKQYLLNPNNQFLVRDLLDYGYQVAKGMNYLSNLKFIHRDLAARNCMVNIHNVVKVADFGLARDIYSNDYYRVENKSRPLPVKWMAPEALDDHKFTSKSDVWSYGILMWELLTRGKKPYAHVDNFEVKHFLKRGNRLDKPAVAPDEVYEMMLQCWNMNPPSRPDFAHIVKELDSVLSDNDDSAVVPKSPSTTPGGSSETYMNLNRYVDHTTDRHGYEDLHAEQGYLDMASQVDYLAAVKELEMDIDGYLAPVNSRPSKTSSGGTKPTPAPRNQSTKGSNKSRPEYQNMATFDGTDTAKSDSIQLVEAPRAQGRDSDIPVYRQTETDTDVPLYTNTQFGAVQT